MKGTFENIINDSRPVIIDFHADWCSPCKIQSPVLKEVVSEFGDRIRVIKIDVDQNNEIAGRYQIRSIPTLLIFQHGKLKYRQSGVHSKHQLVNVINNIH